MRRDKTFKTKGAAQQWVKDLDDAHDAGNYVDPRKGDKPFAEVTAEWLETKQHLEPRSRSDYHSTLRCWLLSERDPLDRRPPFRRKRIGAISAALIEDWLSGFQPARSHRTMAKVYSMLSGKQGIMAFAVRRGYISANPCLSVTLPRASKPAYDPDNEDEGESGIQVLNKAEITQLADAMRTESYRVAIIFAAWMGLRAGELWALKRKDIDWMHGVVQVRRAWKEIHGSQLGDQPRFFLGPVKTQAGRRSIHMPEHIKTLMAQHLTSRPASADSFVFTRPDGNPVRQSRFYKYEFKPAVRSALPRKAGLRFHDLRHTAASFILAVHPNLFLVMKRLGHASMTTTTKTYGHLVGDVDAALAVALDEFYAAPSKVVSLHDQEARSR